jgi:hypothetical protein
MVVRDFYCLCSVMPDEADAALIIDADRVLPFAIIL